MSDPTRNPWGLAAGFAADTALPALIFNIIFVTEYTKQAKIDAGPSLFLLFVVPAITYIVQLLALGIVGELIKGGSYDGSDPFMVAFLPTILTAGLIGLTYILMKTQSTAGRRVREKEEAKAREMAREFNIDYEPAKTIIGMKWGTTRIQILVVFFFLLSVYYGTVINIYRMTQEYLTVAPPASTPTHPHKTGSTE